MALCQGLPACRNDGPTADIVDVRSLELPYSIDNQHTTTYSHTHTEL